MSRSYHLTFDARLRLTAEVRAESGKEAHFAAFCDAVGLLRNDGLVTRQLASIGITVDRLDPLELVRITPLNESMSS